MRSGLADEMARVAAAIDGLLAEGRSGTLHERLNRQVQGEILRGKLRRLEMEALRAYLVACVEVRRRLDAA